MLLSDRNVAATNSKLLKIGVGSGGRNYDHEKNKVKEGNTRQFYYLVDDCFVMLSKQNDRKVTARWKCIRLAVSLFCARYVTKTGHVLECGYFLAARSVENVSQSLAILADFA